MGIAGLWTKHFERNALNRTKWYDSYIYPARKRETDYKVAYFETVTYPFHDILNILDARFFLVS